MHAAVTRARRGDARHDERATRAASRAFGACRHTPRRARTRTEVSRRCRLGGSRGTRRRVGGGGMNVQRVADDGSRRRARARACRARARARTPYSSGAHMNSASALSAARVSGLVERSTRRIVTHSSRPSRFRRSADVGTAGSRGMHHYCRSIVTLVARDRRSTQPRRRWRRRLSVHIETRPCSRGGCRRRCEAALGVLRPARDVVSLVTAARDRQRRRRLCFMYRDVDRAPQRVTPSRRTGGGGEIGARSRDQRGGKASPTGRQDHHRAALCSDRGADRPSVLTYNAPLERRGSAQTWRGVQRRTRSEVVRGGVPC